PPAARGRATERWRIDPSRERRLGAHPAGRAPRRQRRKAPPATSATNHAQVRDGLRRADGRSPRRAPPRQLAWDRAPQRGRARARWGPGRAAVVPATDQGRALARSLGPGSDAARTTALPRQAMGPYARP